MPPPAPTALRSGSYGHQVALALGLSNRAAPLFGGLSHADDGADVAAARAAMNTVLWPATWQYFLEHMMAPVLGDGLAARGRRHFIANVRACGPLPVLRVGNQPYGLLPVTPLGTWAPREPAGTPGGDGDLAGLVRFLQSLRPGREQVAGGGAPPGSGVAVRPGRPTGGSTAERPRDAAVLGRIPRPVGARSRLHRRRLAVLGNSALDETWWQAQGERGGQLLAALGLDWKPNLLGATFALNYFPLPSPPVSPAAPSMVQPRTYLGALAKGRVPGTARRAAGT